jgi:hypothetical protein
MGESQSKQQPCDPTTTERKFILNKNKKSQQEKLKIVNLQKKSNLSHENLDNYYSEFEHVNCVSDTKSNNFLNTFLVAYNNHLPLKIRPDDIHVALQLIFSTCITNNAEKLREYFVEHEGKKELNVELSSFDAQLAFSLFKKEIKKNIKCPEFADKSIADYTTTTPIVSNTSNSLLMNSIKEYFTYSMTLSCGIPQVHLMGTLDDWNELLAYFNYMESILSRTELSSWFHHFRKILHLFLDMAKMNSCDLQNTEYSKFWSRVITFVPYGSGGPAKLGGWIVLFFPYSTSKKIIQIWQNELDMLIFAKEPNLTNNNFNQNQDINVKFWSAIDQSDISASALKTPVTICYTEIHKSYKCEFYSGFFEPAIIDDIVSFNMGTIIRNDTEAQNDTDKKYYLSLGVKEEKYSVSIPYYLLLESGKITKLFNSMWHNCYETEKCKELKQKMLLLYEQIGVYHKGREVYAPSKFYAHKIIFDKKNGKNIGRAISNYHNYFNIDMMNCVFGASCPKKYIEKNASEEEKNANKFVVDPLIHEHKNDTEYEKKLFNELFVLFPDEEAQKLFTKYIFCAKN